VRGFRFRDISPTNLDGEPTGGRYLEQFSVEYNRRFRDQFRWAAFVDARVDVAGLDSAWRTRCLLRKKFCLDTLILDEVRFTQKPTEAVASTSTGPIELPTVSLPLDVSVNDLRIKRFVFQPVGDAPSHTVENIRLVAKAKGDTLYIEDLSAAYQSYTAAVNGEVQLDGDYPLDLDLALNATNLWTTRCR